MVFQDPLIDFITNFVIKLADHFATQYGPVVAKKLREQARQVKIQKPFFAIKGNLVNRVSDLKAIRAALDTKNSTRVLYFYGPGGAGKTRLLEEARNIAQSASSLRWAGIFDLYHTDLHNILRLHSAIIENLDPGGQHFSAYRKAKEAFENNRREGVFSASSDTVIRAEIEHINQLFVDEFNQYTSKYRAVLAFDTLENICEEQDLVQRIFGLGGGRSSLSVRQWLLDLCREVENTVILLAGRPNSEMKSDLEHINTIHVGRVETISIEGLTQADTADLLSVYTRKAPRPIAELLTQNTIMIWQATKGLPVHVALLVELVLQNPEILNNEEKKKDPELGRKIVRAFFDRENPERRHFYFLALARKGLTPDLLHSLEQKWTEEECAKRLNTAEHSTLTKKRHGEKELFLHDACYEVFDSFAPYDEEEKVYWFQRLKEYYLQALNEENRVNLLYYDLRCDFLQAFYQTFVRYSEIAIKGGEFELDSQLRNEVLIYLRNDYQHMMRTDIDLDAVFIQDSATRWIKRLISQTYYEQAIELAETFLSLADLIDAPSLLDIPEDTRAKLKSYMTSAPPIIRASLFAYYGEALIYLAEKSEEEIQTFFQRVIEFLESPSFGQGAPRWWLRNRILGRTYDRLGYLARANGHYQRAVEYYRKALSFYKETEIADEFAFTQNNLAFVLALLGDTAGAKSAAEEALVQRLKLGQRYPVALSYNTRGLISALDNPDSFSGQRDCELALSIFEEINTPRGTGLACNALGFILRKRGAGWTSNQCTSEQALQWYAESGKYFERAKEIFKDGEKIRLWEALNELGSLNRDWACLLNHLKDAEGAKKRFDQSLGFQRQALTLAQESNMRFQQIDTLDDMAELYMDQGDFDEARKNIESCKALIPPEFNLADAQKQPHPGEVYWFSLAKIQLREGMLKTQMARRETPPDNRNVVDGLHCLLTAFVYFLLYSEKPNFLKQKASEIVALLKELELPSALIADAFRKVVGEHGFDLSILCSVLQKEYRYEQFSCANLG
jgi:tetratricopeptide (TPR) repeat protein